MTTHQYVLAGSGICTGIATLLSAVLIQQHMQYFSKPIHQSKVVGILWMVPIYSIDSWLSLTFKDYALYLDMIRDCYEVGFFPRTSGLARVICSHLITMLLLVMVVHARPTCCTCSWRCWWRTWGTGTSRR